MSNILQPIDTALAKSLAAKSDQELFSILESPADWRPEVLDFVRAELGRRSSSPAQIDQKLAESTQRKNEEFKKRADVPLTFWETFFIALYGAGFGPVGLSLVWQQASQFMENGYVLKAKKSWQLFWFAFGVWLLVAVVFLVIVALL